MIQGPLSPVEAVMVALSGFVIVFLMLALLWGVIIVVYTVSSAAWKRKPRRSRRRPSPQRLRLLRPLPRPRRPPQRRRSCWRALTKHRRHA